MRDGASRPIRLQVSLHRDKSVCSFGGQLLGYRLDRWRSFLKGPSLLIVRSQSEPLLVRIQPVSSYACAADWQLQTRLADLRYSD